MVIHVLSVLFAFTLVSQAYATECTTSFDQSCLSGEYDAAGVNQDYERKKQEQEEIEKAEAEQAGGNLEWEREAAKLDAFLDIEDAEPNPSQFEGLNPFTAAKEWQENKRRELRRRNAEIDLEYYNQKQAIPITP